MSLPKEEGPLGYLSRGVLFKLRATTKMELFPVFAQEEGTSKVRFPQVGNSRLATNLLLTNEYVGLYPGIQP